jgi:hypothetical protein
MPQNNYSGEILYIGPPPVNRLGRKGFWTSVFGLATCGLLSPLGLVMSFLALGKKPRGAAAAGVILGLIGSLWIGMLGASAISAAMHAAARAEHQRARATQNVLVQAQGVIERHRSETGRLPEGIEGNKLVLSFTDVWNNAVRYDGDDNGYAIRSAGPDGKFDTPDDLVHSPISSTE